jgi:hypothetical protein
MTLVLIVAGGVALAATVSCSGAFICDGTDGDDTIRGTSASEDIYGFGGSDTIKGNGGDDKMFGDGLVGGAPNPTLDGNDQMDGGPGTDRLYGYGSSDKLIGGSGGDYIDAVYAETPEVPGTHNTIRAGGGNDIVDAVNGVPDSIDCGSGKLDEAYVDVGLDTVAANCERV